MSWIDQHAAAIQALATAISAIVTIILVIVTWKAGRTTRSALKAAREANENAVGMRRDQAGAVLDPMSYSISSGPGGTHVQLEFANTGASCARNLRQRLILPDGTAIEGSPRLVPLLNTARHEARRTVRFPLGDANQVDGGFEVEWEYEDRFGPTVFRTPFMRYRP